MRPLISLLLLTTLFGCSRAPDAAPSVPPKAAETGPVATAQTVSNSFADGEMKAVRANYVSGLAFRAENTALAVLTTQPLSACDRLGLLARASSNLDWIARTRGALLVLERAEGAEPAAKIVEPYVSTTLVDPLPSLVTDGNTLSLSGSFGSVDSGPMMGEKKTEAALVANVRLPYATLAEFDATKADTSASAVWLRAQMAKAKDDAEAVVEATIAPPDESDPMSGVNRGAWFNVLANYADINVIAEASEADCATLVIRAPGFSGGYSEALIETRGTGEARKVTAVNTTDAYGDGEPYLIGRVDHHKLGAFPLLHSRVTANAGGGPELCFSDLPIGAGSLEQVGAKQRAVCLSAGSYYSARLAGPGVPLFEQSSMESPIANEQFDEQYVGGLYRTGTAGVDRIVLNFRVALPKPAP
jgi:hypothetical protein